MTGLPELNLPLHPLRLEERGGELRVFDPLRRKWVVLTPEEHVRQRFTAWLTQELGYPAAMVANEVQVELNGTRKRCDTVVYGRLGEPAMIVEYKAPHVRITQGVFDQIVRYNMVLRVGVLVVSNGLEHYCCRVDCERGSYGFLRSVPAYGELCGEGKNDNDE